MNKGSTPLWADKEMQTPANCRLRAICCRQAGFELMSSVAEPLFQTFSSKQQPNYEYQHAQRDRRAQGPVISGSEETHDYIRDHDPTRAPNQDGRKKISQAEYECERRAGDHPRQ